MSNAAACKHNSDWPHRLKPMPRWKAVAWWVWAVKPQTFKTAAMACRTWTGQALHLSVAAGIRSDSMADWLGTERLVRAMPNTGPWSARGMTGLYARPA